MATFEHQHFTIVLPELSDLTVARLLRSFDAPVANPAQPGIAMTTNEIDLEVDFMDMTNSPRLWARVEDARPGFVPVAGRHVTVGCDDAEPAVAKVLSVNVDGDIELEVLPGPVESHRDPCLQLTLSSAVWAPGGS